jgi:enamine deaminase RidA (YjgF/YER057c/UK114 family)
MAVSKFNPEGVAAPASRYSHVALAEGGVRLAAFAGQVGVRPDGSLPESLAAQLEQCFANVDACLHAAGMARENLMRITVYVTDPSAETVATYRARRDAWIGEGAAPAATYVVVAGLAAPGLLCEVEALAAG